jgi:alkanesulfonate monooxygenase SsuD/methylene tetrahydromethanopterin reductase-like flavin-dependent oxidoreductase (luciferase family)
VALAEQLAVCDILCGGRLRVGVGMGRMNDWRPSYAHEGLTFGAPLTAKDRAPVFEEHVQVMKKCWQPGPFKHSGTYYDFPEIDVTPKPLQRGGPEVWFGVGPARSALRRAARLGNGLNNGVGAIVPYLEEVRAQGRMAEAGKVTIVAPHYPARDPERAEAMFGEHIDYLWHWYKMPENPWAAPHFLEPAEVARELREAKELGATGAWWFAPFSGAVPSETVEIYETIINDVKPLVEAEEPASV